MTRTQEQLWRSMALAVIRHHGPVTPNQILQILHGDLDAIDVDGDYEPTIDPPDSAELSDVLEQAVHYGLAEKENGKYRAKPTV